MNSVGLVVGGSGIKKGRRPLLVGGSVGGSVSVGVFGVGSGVGSGVGRGDIGDFTGGSAVISVGCCVGLGVL